MHCAKLVYFSITETDGLVFSKLNLKIAAFVFSG